MKILFWLLMAIVPAAIQAQDLHVMTFNIRYNNPGDSLNSWPYRKEKLASQIKFYDIELLGVQEALVGQMKDLQQLLPKYKTLGVGRDGVEKGEYSAIFYDTARLQLLQGETFWLSETPAIVASKSWDAALTRIVTWAKFRDRKSKKIFYAFNTHFDHIGQVARRESAKLLLQKVKDIAGNTPAIITGDFNAKPSDEPIRVIVDANNPLRLTDTKGISATPHYGPEGTFNGWTSKEIHTEPIDHIFVKGKWKVLKHATISETWEGRFASDHFSVITTVLIP
jgi:endonuclease/exonuclease/phosphatase family metal-dependent hydrolase